MLTVLVGVGLLAAVIRSAWLEPPGPGLAAGDETVMVSRGISLYHGVIPGAYDWPTGCPLMLAMVMRIANLVFGFDIHNGPAVLLLGRLVSVAAGTLLAMATGVLAAQLCRRKGSRRWAAGLAGTTMALAFIAVAASRLAIPEVQQDAAVAVCLVCILNYDRTRDRRVLVVAGLLAGLAAGGKYVGGVVLLTLAASVMTSTEPVSRKLRHLAVAVVAAGGAFVLAVPAMLTAPAQVFAGIHEQVLHAQNGHVGFDSDNLSLWYHLGITIPGSIGWFWTGAGYAGTLFAFWTKDRGWRLLGFFALAGLATIGTSHLIFPRYALMPLAAIVALGAGLVLRAVEHLAVRRSAPISWIVVLAAVVALAWPATSALRALAAAHAERTEILASQFAHQLSGRIVAEPYTLPSTDPVVHVSSLAGHPELISCDCYLLISSYIESRYRAEPARYPKEVAAYDQIRRLGTIVDVVSPSIPLSYRWETLPRYGTDNVPLNQPVIVGPTITIVRIP